MFYFKFYYFPVLMKLEHVKIQLQIVRLLKRYWMARACLVEEVTPDGSNTYRMGTFLNNSISLSCGRYFII